MPCPRTRNRLPFGCARRNANRDALAVERADADPRAEGRLCDVDRHGRDDVESLASEETIGLDLKGDHEIARRAIMLTAAALTLQANARAIVRARAER